MENKEVIARDVYRKVKEKQLKEFQERMPENKQGVEFEANGVKYVAAIRRLTPQECAELQTMPHGYEFVTSETQQYKAWVTAGTLKQSSTFSVSFLKSS